MITTLAAFHFIRPLWLILIPVLGILWYFWNRQIDPLRGWRSQIEPELLEALTQNKSTQSNIQPYGILGLWMLLTIAIAGPTWQLEKNPFAQDAQPLIIILKASESMETSTGSASFLELAKLKIADLAKARKGDPLGLVAYAGSAHIVLPPTEDTDVVAEMASEISPHIMPVPGDQLDDAISTASKLIQQKETGGTLLVLADSAEIDPSIVAGAYQAAGSLPIQFLTLTTDKFPEFETIRSVSKALSGTIQNASIDDKDIQNVISFAGQRSSTGIAGESRRWQEAGYWLTPVLVLIIAISFRSQQTVAEDSQR